MLPCCLVALQSLKPPNTGAVSALTNQHLLVKLCSTEKRIKEKYIGCIYYDFICIWIVCFDKTLLNIRKESLVNLFLKFLSIASSWHCFFFFSVNQYCQLFLIASSWLYVYFSLVLSYQQNCFLDGSLRILCNLFTCLHLFVQTKNPSCNWDP